MTDKVQSVYEAFYACLDKAEKLYKIDLFDVELDLTLKGKSCLGQAIKHGDTLIVKLNEQAVEHYTDHLINDTIPHEVAHIVQFALGRKGGHGTDWKLFCGDLGGDPERVAKGDFSKLQPARKPRKARNFVYVLEDDSQVILTLIRHNKLQKGKVSCYVTSDNKEVRAKHFIKEID